MKWIVAERRNAPPARGSDKRRHADETPLSSSGVVAKGTAPAVRARSSEPPLTPYQARLDVEMDDTAVSKVRDPSVSISLSAEGLLPILAPRRARKPLDAVYSIVLGTLLGAVLVVLAVVAARLVAK
jgi:uncharacterized protein YjeT (DUF2065 family)